MSFGMSVVYGARLCKMKTKYLEHINVHVQVTDNGKISVFQEPKHNYLCFPLSKNE